MESGIEVAKMISGKMRKLELLDLNGNKFGEDGKLEVLGILEPIKSAVGTMSEDEGEDDEEEEESDAGQEDSGDEEEDVVDEEDYDNLEDYDEYDEEEDYEDEGEEYDDEEEENGKFEGFQLVVGLVFNF